MSVGIFTSLENNIQGSLEKARYLEDKLTAWKSLIDGYKLMIDDGLTNNISDLQDRLNLSSLEDSLESSAWFDKIKDVDISGLLDISAIETGQEIHEIVKTKIEWVIAILNQHQILDSEYIARFERMISNLLQLPEAIEDEGANELLDVYQTIASSGLKEDLNQLATMLKPIENIVEEASDTIKSVAAELEDQLGILEQALDLDLVGDTIRRLVRKVLPNSFPVNKEDVELFLDFIIPEIKKIDFKQPEKIIARDIVARVAELADQYFADKPKFSTLNMVIQKLAEVICLLLDDKINLRHLGKEEKMWPLSSLPKIQYTPLPPPAPSKPNSDAGTVQRLATVSSTTPLTPPPPPPPGSATIQVDFSAIVHKLLEEGIYLLPTQSATFAQSLIDGTAFSMFEDNLKVFFMEIEDTMIQIKNDIEVAFLYGIPLTMKDFIRLIFDQFNSAIAAVFAGIMPLAKSITSLCADIAGCVLDILLAIKLPRQVENLAPSLSGISLPCILVAFPWAIVEQLTSP